MIKQRMIGRSFLLLLLCLVPLCLCDGGFGADIVAHEKLEAKQKSPDPPLPQPSSDKEADEGGKGGADGRAGKVEDESSLGFWHAFAASISVIIVSELGDKTWFIAAILAMRHSRATVFAGAMAALALMTALSAGLGWATQIIPRAVTYYVSTALFALFGLKMLKEGYDMPAGQGAEEYEEAQAEIKKKEEEIEADVEAGGVPAQQSNSSMAITRLVSRILMEAFTLTFLAEWGDRSQLTTIILAARENVLGVTLGGILGHAVCTGIAVLGGRIVAQKISVRSVTLIGGVVFLLFALSALFFKPDPD